MHSFTTLYTKIPQMNHIFNQIRYKSYKLVVIGGGTGGCSAAAKFTSKFGKGEVAVIEPNDVHYYQPMFTLVGGGLKKFQDTARPMEKVLPKSADWIRDKVVSFHPDKNTVKTSSGEEISYEFLIISMGLQLNYDAIKGLPGAMDTPGVCSNYSPQYVNKTFECLQKFDKGNAIFTFPNTPVKCAGAPQKIMYLVEHFLATFASKRQDANIMYNTALPVLFGVKVYADALWKIVKKRNINVNLSHNLIEVKSKTKEAIFEVLTEPGKTVTVQYEMLHVTPPMSTPNVLKECKELVDTAGFLNLDRETLQHVTYKNIFGVGDCTNLPTSKTGAAVAAQLGILRKNLKAAINGTPLTASYDGYTSCPLVTGGSNCILAEFDYNLQPLETFPINQAKEMKIMYFFKAHMMPILYWKGMLNGYWEGPKIIRKAFRLGMGK